MKWIETIELRSTDPSDSHKDIDLEGPMANLPATGRPYEIIFLEHGTIETDVSIHLMFDSPHAGLFGSELGLRLKEILRERGLVSHKVWIEAGRYQKTTDSDTS